MYLIEIAINNMQVLLDVDEEQLFRTVRHVFEHMDTGSGIVSLVIVDNVGIRKLKKEYFGLDEATDVVSFDLSDQAGLEYEVVVNAERAKELACDDKAAQGELNLYIVHGLLHQFGYNDQEPSQATAMHLKEDELLDELGFGRVYFDASAKNREGV